MDKLHDGESLEIEFKEITIDIDYGKYLSEDEIIEIVKKGTYSDIIDHLMIKNLESFIYKYLTRYIVSFTNCYEITKGSLYFGVSDDGELTGFPFRGEINEDIIKTLVENSLSKIRLIEADTSKVIKVLSKNEILDKLNIRLIKIEPSISEKYSDIDDHIKNIYDTYAKEYKEYITTKNEREEWYKEFKVYDKKVIEVANDMSLREQMREYIIKCENYSTEIAPKEHIIEQIDNSHIFSFEDEDVPMLKEISTHPVFWITEFKDHMRRNILSKKPLVHPKPSIEKRDYLITQLFTLLTPMISKWHASSIPYYIIVIDIDAQTEDDTYLEYSLASGLDDDKFEHWLYRRRIDDENNGPSCTQN
jgi:hypothetical protein